MARCAITDYTPSRGDHTGSDKPCSSTETGKLREYTKGGEEADKGSSMNEAIFVAPRRPEKPVKYRIGDQVMLRITDYERSDLPKLRKQWAGPFDVLQVMGPTA